jgi:hypothetical protein
VASTLDDEIDRIWARGLDALLRHPTSRFGLSHEAVVADR